jgi:predicted kinase
MNAKLKIMFDQIQQLLKASSMWTAMLNVKEDSQWHREDNVAEHTRMVLAWYDENLAASRDAYSRFLTKTALLFHDVGKPMAREPVEKDGVTYFRYPMHEQYSARLFENFVVENDLLGNVIDVADFRRIKWLIENHLPYGITNSKNLNALKFDLNAQNPANAAEGMLQRVFFDILLSDAHGRISDDHAQKLSKVNVWINDFSAHEIQLIERKKFNAEKIMIIAVGTAGSGKSTYFDSIRKVFSEYGLSCETLSLDLYRLSFFEKQNGRPPKDVSEAFYYSNCDDIEKEFIKFWQNESVQAIKSCPDRIILDNTNLTRKRRQFWIHNAHNHGYKVVAVEFINSLTELKHRQLSRGQKRVHENVVERQYFSQSCVNIGREADELYLMFQQNDLLMLYAETQKAYNLAC